MLPSGCALYHLCDPISTLVISFIKKYLKSDILIIATTYFDLRRFPSVSTIPTHEPLSTIMAFAVRRRQ